MSLHRLLPSNHPFKWTHKDRNAAFIRQMCCIFCQRCDQGQDKNHLKEGRAHVGSCGLMVGEFTLLWRGIHGGREWLLGGCLLTSRWKRQPTQAGSRVGLWASRPTLNDLFSCQHFLKVSQPSRTLAAAVDKCLNTGAYMGVGMEERDFHTQSTAMTKCYWLHSRAVSQEGSEYKKLFKKK